MAADSLIFYP